MAWKEAEGKWPGKSNRMAQFICELLWQSAGGGPHGSIAARERALTAWRKHLVTARRNYRPTHRARMLVERILARTRARLSPQQDQQRRPLDEETRRLFYNHPHWGKEVARHGARLRAGRLKLLSLVQRRYGVFST
jgi:hypothetical protein